MCSTAKSVLAGAALGLAVAAGGAVGAGPAGPTTVTLEFQPAGGVYTPARILDAGRRFRFDGAAGKVDILGEQILVGAKYVGTGYLVGLDCNGDKAVTGSEWVRLDPLTHTAKFLLARKDGERVRRSALRMVGVGITIRANRIANFSGRIVSAGCLAGKLAGRAVLLFDDNADGKYTQDGKDAVALGRAAGAVPLYRRHMLDGRHYELEVAPDGSQVTFRPVEETSLALVDVPVPAGLLRCLVLVDEAAGRACEVRSAGKAGIPAGTYRLAYAVLAAGERMVVARPTEKSPAYTLTPNKLNILRFGPPYTLGFTAWVDRRRDQIRIGNDIRPYGAGGEEYLLRFAGYHPFGENPHVVFTNGRMVLTDVYMTYDAEHRLMPFAEYIPAGMNRSTGRVVLTCDLPLLGRATGFRTMAEVLERKKPEPPAAKSPAVAVRDLPAGIALGPRPEPPPKPAPAPRPARPPLPPPRPRPAPSSRPSRPRPADPEYDAGVALAVARGFLKQGRTDLGIAKLKELIAKYPNTYAAREADSILIDIEIARESDKPDGGGP